MRLGLPTLLPDPGFASSQQAEPVYSMLHISPSSVWTLPNLQTLLPACSHVHKYAITTYMPLLLFIIAGQQGPAPVHGLLLHTYLGA